jgi:hypothetical protein
MKHIDEIVEQMKALAEHLIPYNFPCVAPEEEDEIHFLKFCDVLVDGYDVVLHLNKHDYEDHYLETFQVLSKTTPFLPFALVCKLAIKFLGSENLSLLEILKDGRKIYCWTIIRDKSGNIVENPYKEKAENCFYEDFEYSYVTPDKVKFY